MSFSMDPVWSMDFGDIVDRISERPKWWWGNIPRYEEFGLECLQGVVADEALLVELRCAHCNHRFDLAIFFDVPNDGEVPKSFREWIELDRHIPFIGHPPSAPWCDSRNYNSDQVRILQFWSWNRGSLSWRRERELEIELADS